jgi:hypothetical protein
VHQEVAALSKSGSHLHPLMSSPLRPGQVFLPQADTGGAGQSSRPLEPGKCREAVIRQRQPMALASIDDGHCTATTPATEGRVPVLWHHLPAGVVRLRKVPVMESLPEYWMDP